MTIFYSGIQTRRHVAVIKRESSVKMNSIPASLARAAGLLLMDSTGSFLLRPSVDGVWDQEVQESQPSAERFESRQQVQRFPLHRPTWNLSLRQEFSEQTAREKTNINTKNTTTVEKCFLGKFSSLYGLYAYLLQTQINLFVPYHG
jgi:hypothetical protein